VLGRLTRDSRVANTSGSTGIRLSVSLPTQPAQQVWVSHPRQPVLEATARGPGAGAACRTCRGPDRALPLPLLHRVPTPTLGFLACAREISSQPEASGPNVRPPRSLECPPHHHSLLCHDHPLDFPHAHRRGRVSHRASRRISHLVLAPYRLPVALLVLLGHSTSAWTPGNHWVSRLKALWLPATARGQMPGLK
jgi:hypothetical protein